MKALVSVMLLLLLPVAVEAACTTGLISIATPGVAFGNYDPNSATDTTTSAPITISCTLGGSLPSFTLAISKGGGSFSQRQMAFLLATLNYNLYTTGSYNVIWGDGTNSTVTQSYGGGGSSTGFTIYGKIPTRQFVAAGIYGDIVTVTVTY